MMHLAVTLALVGCNPTTPEPEPEAKVEEAPTDPVIPEPAAKEASAAASGLVPSVLETEKAMKASGVDTELATLTEPRTYDLSADAPDRAAVRTGVVLADMLLTVKTSSKERLQSQLGAVRKGMEQLNGGSDIDRTIQDYEERVSADAVTRDELLTEFDELSGAVIPELTFNGNERVVPLISAGSWLEGTHLVAKALAGQPAEQRAQAEKLLKAPSVVEYFSQYVAQEGEAAPEPVSAQLKTTLSTLGELSRKDGALSDDELNTIVKTTGDVLALL